MNEGSNHWWLPSMANNEVPPHSLPLAVAQHCWQQQPGANGWRQLLQTPAQLLHHELHRWFAAALRTPQLRN
jgi:allophanate hydrolase subunit 1